MDDHIAKIRALNDTARTTFRGCRLMITAGIQEFSTIEVADILRKVKEFNAFTQDNDPHGEHDFGSIRHCGETVFWKFDYYDLTLTAGSEDPSDPDVTTRVLTILLATEY